LLGLGGSGENGEHNPLGEVLGRRLSLYKKGNRVETKSSQFNTAQKLRSGGVREKNQNTSNICA